MFNNFALTTNIDNFITSLGIMWKGMLALFLVLGLIALIVLVMTKLQKPDKPDDAEEN